MTIKVIGNLNLYTLYVYIKYIHTKKWSEVFCLYGCLFFVCSLSLYNMIWVYFYLYMYISNVWVNSVCVCLSVGITYGKTKC